MDTAYVSYLTSESYKLPDNELMEMRVLIFYIFFSVLIIHPEHSRLGLIYILISIGIRHRFRNMSCKYDLQLTIVAVGLEPRLHVRPVTLDPVDLGADRVETLLNCTVEALYEKLS